MSTRRGSPRLSRSVAAPVLILLTTTVLWAGVGCRPNTTDALDRGRRSSAVGVTMPGDTRQVEAVGNGPSTTDVSDRRPSAEDVTMLVDTLQVTAVWNGRKSLLSTQAALEVAALARTLLVSCTDGVLRIPMARDWDALRARGHYLELRWPKGQEMATGLVPSITIDHLLVQLAPEGSGSGQIWMKYGESYLAPYAACQAEVLEALSVQAQQAAPED